MGRPLRADSAAITERTRARTERANTLPPDGAEWNFGINNRENMNALSAALRVFGCSESIGHISLNLRRDEGRYERGWHRGSFLPAGLRYGGRKTRTWTWERARVEVSQTFRSRIVMVE